MEFKKEHLPFLDDSMYLPIQYKDIKANEPSYEGEGNHSVGELEAICKQYFEYCHQQSVIKNNAMKAVIENKFGVEFK